MLQKMMAPRLADLCTMHLGGKPKHYVRSLDYADITETVSLADRSCMPLLMLGGGSNLVPADEGFDGIVIQDRRNGMTRIDDFSRLRMPGRNSCSQEALVRLQQCGDCQAIIQADSGCSWDELVEFSVDQGLVGLEALSGIPGSVGAAPVQNIGAYGAEVADALFGVTTWDRMQRKLCYVMAKDLQFGYRNSIFKRSRRVGDATGRWIIMRVDFLLRRWDLRNPDTGSEVRYQQLADLLGVPLGSRVEPRLVRQAVLELRRSKGMVLDAADRDTWSVGSFFTNPVLERAHAAVLPAEAPRFEVSEANFGPGGAGWENLACNNADSGAAGVSAEPKLERKVKTSAAWLIAHAGITKGFSLPGSGIAVSSKHVLALTNRGNGTAAQVRELSDYIVAAVRGSFGVTLTPEPVIL